MDRRETDRVDWAEDVVLPHTQAGDEEQSHDSYSQRRDSSPSSFRPQRKHKRAAILGPAKSASPCTNAPRATWLPASSGLPSTGAYHTFSCDQSRGASLVSDGGRSTASAHRVSCSSFAEPSTPHRTGADGSSAPSGTRSRVRGLYVTGELRPGTHLGHAGGSN